MKKVITVNDKMQKGYKYTLTKRMGKDFDPRFRPDLSPKEMLHLGVFGGLYMTDCGDEFPKTWFKTAKFSKPDLFGKKKYQKDLNFFRVQASQSLAEWNKKGWIHPDDPRGWFQWYCRYYMGRRHVDDERQIKRWVNMKRHIIWLQNACRKGDIFCRPRQRQALLHWAYDSREL